MGVKSGIFSACGKGRRYHEGWANSKVTNADSQSGCNAPRPRSEAVRRIGASTHHQSIHRGRAGAFSFPASAANYGANIGTRFLVYISG